MDSRKIFDTIPEEFDKWRPRYCDELFSDIIEYSKLDSSKSALEIGPGTGQATEPVLKTGCSYLAIELGENLAEFMKNKFGSYDNFKLVNADFELYDFEKESFDLVYSAAAFQWINEEIGYPKVYNMLKSGGTFARFGTGGRYGTDDNDPLYIKIQEVYSEYFKPETEYKCKLPYNTVEKYDFIDIEYRHYNQIREFTADDYVSYIKTHSDHISLQEPYKSKFYAGIRDVILSFGNKITLYDKIDLCLARKP